MFRFIRTLLAAVIAFTIGAIGTANADTSAVWSQRADKAITAFIAADNGAAGPFAYAYMADAIARQSPRGWSDPAALGYLRRVLAYQQADGGFGLTYAWDAFADGTVNPKDTSYTVSMTDHVGPTLLAAYQAGKVSRTVIDRMITEVLSVPRWNVSYGTCVAYSDNPYDFKGGYCVHNVNASVGLFLTQAKAAGFGDWSALTSKITSYELTRYGLYSPYFWPYRNGVKANNDWDHNALNAEAMLTLSPAVGREVVDYMLTHVGDATAPLSHARLAKFRLDVTNSDYDTYFASLATLTVSKRLGRYAQLAHWAAQAADA